MIDERRVERVTIDIFPIDCIVTFNQNSNEEPIDYYRPLMSTITDDCSGQIVSYMLNSHRRR